MIRTDGQYLCEGIKKKYTPMDFWNHKVNVSKEAAERQIAIINTFPPEKRMKIAIDFAEFGISRTREWIKKNNPNLSERGVTLEFVRLMHYEKGHITQEHWEFYKKKMTQKINNDKR